MTDLFRTAAVVAILVALTGCASTSARVNGGGSEHGAGGTATLGTGVKF